MANHLRPDLDQFLPQSRQRQVTHRWGSHLIWFFGRKLAGLCNFQECLYKNAVLVGLVCFIVVAGIVGLKFNHIDNVFIYLACNQFEAKLTPMMKSKNVIIPDGSKEINRRVWRIRNIGHYFRRHDRRLNLTAFSGGAQPLVFSYGRIPISFGNQPNFSCPITDSFQVKSRGLPCVFIAKIKNAARIIIGGCLARICGWQNPSPFIERASSLHFFKLTAQNLGGFCSFTILKNQNYKPDKAAQNTEDFDEILYPFMDGLFMIAFSAFIGWSWWQIRFERPIRHSPWILCLIFFIGCLGFTVFGFLIFAHLTS